MNFNATTARSLVSTAAVLAALSGVAIGQDSVSRNAGGGNGLPGDALSPWTTTTQRVNYVVDLCEFSTASGIRFGLAPVMKSGRTSASRFSGINGASSISQTVKNDASYPTTTYVSWSAPAGGVHPVDNDPALNQPVSASGSATVFGIGFMDFDEVLVGATNVFVNHLYGGLVAFDPASPSRLYVSRINGAINASLNTTDRSQFGYGGIDSDGNLVFRADGFGAAGPATSVLVGDNYFRVRLPQRSLFAANLIDNNGGSNSAATDWILQRSTMTHAAPSLLPANIASRGFLVGTDFAGGLKLESSPSTLTPTTAHRPSTLDHRGGANVSGKVVFPGSAATSAILTRSSSGTGKTDSISIFGLTSSGDVSTSRTFTMPAALTDACDSFPWPLGGGDFRNYDSQVTFRGGASPVATGRDQAGNALAAAVLYNGGNQSPSNPFNAIAAMRFDPTVGNSTAQWTALAWVNATTLDGKLIFGDFGADGVPGTGDVGENDGLVDGTDASIGRLAAMSEADLGFAGPSLSAPAFDSAGNAYFIASVALKKRLGPQDQYDYKLALIRGVINPATFCYSLDLVMEVGQVFQGANSGRNYQIAALNLADADSVSTASLWSASATQQAWNNIDNASLPPANPQNLGGLVLSARIIYDIDQDGQYEDPTALSGDVNSVDEAYNVVLYVGNTTGNTYCPADFNQDGGVDGQDVEAFFIEWTAGLPSADVNQDGGVDGQDVETFFISWEAGGCV